MRRETEPLYYPFRPFARLLVVALALFGAAACSDNRIVPEDGPRLVSEVTIPPVTNAPTRALSPTPTRAETEPATLPPIMTMTASDFSLVTPTLPPSKTPTLTPTLTETPRFTAPPPTLAVLAQDPILVPTQVFIEPQQAAALAAAPTLAAPSGALSLPIPGTPFEPQQACTAAQWFFTNPRLPECPPNPPVITDGVYQGFQYGFMIWVGAQDAIYVVYDSADAPRWQVFQDQFVEGMPESDPALDALAPPYADWQPRRGFGLVWRSTPGMLERIGWAESAYEQVYEVALQTRADGTIFIREPGGRVISLLAGGANWALYDPR